MNYDAVQRFRQPAAWALIAAAGLQTFAGLILLFIAPSFTFQALAEVSSSGTITGVTLASMVVLAVLLVTWGENPSPQARGIVLAGLAVLGVAAVFSLVAWLASLGAPGDETGSGAGVKTAVFLFGAAKLIVVGVAGYFAYTALQALRPARSTEQPGPIPPGQEGYQAYGYPQQQYGGYPQQPSSYGQQYAQYGQQDFQQQQPQHAQQPYVQPQQDYQQQQDYLQQPPSGYAPQQPAEGEGDAGLWTRSYGSSDQQADPPAGPQQPRGYPQPREENDQNWYRDDRRS